MERGNLVGADAKLAWVDDELELLQDKITAWVEDRRNRYTTTSDFYPCVDVDVVAVRAAFPSLPLEFSVITGNIIHCCRSALDYLIADLAILNGNDPVEGPGGNQFPIFSSAPRGRTGKPIPFATKTSGVLRGLDPSHVAMVQRLQPYLPCNQVANAENALESLARLSNADKHRVLHVLQMGLLGGTRVGVYGTAQRDIADILKFSAILVGPYLKHGSVLACAEIVPSGPDPQIGIDTELPSQVILEDGWPLMLILETIYVSVRCILDWFRPLFSREGPGEFPAVQRFT